MAAALTPWRWAAALALVLVVGAPLALPIFELSQRGFGALTADELERIGQLFANTFLLVAGTLALTLPVGTALALVLFRTQFPGRRCLLALVAIMLFVPLPMITSAWQAFFGSDGWLHLALWGDNIGRPWTTGLMPAIWVHAIAGLPWVICFVGLGLRWVEQELEEYGLLLGPPWWVISKITLPRCRGAIVFAAVWLALQTAGEISVTDMMLVDTFAEEAQTQLTTGGRDGWARAVAAALPLILATWCFLAWYVPRLHTLLPPLHVFATDLRSFAWRRWRWPLVGVAILILSAAFGVPLASLLWKLGQVGHPPRWQFTEAWRRFVSAQHIDGGAVAANLATVGVTGITVAMAALWLCWLSEESRWLRRIMIAVLAFAWSLPGPVLGIGLKESLQAVVDRLPQHSWIAQALYDGPSPLPLAWAYLVRYLPFAVALLWPIVRLTPREPREAARLEGHGPWHEFWIVVWPTTRPAVLLCSVLVAALSLGEVASIRVETPGWRSFAKLLFDRMHSGVDNSIAALCLLLLAGLIVVAVCGCLLRIVFVIKARNRRASSTDA